MEFDPDLRKFKVGDWEGAKLQAKVNGKWVYFYRENEKTPVNNKEPISFDVPYRPPNHRNEKFNVYQPEYVQPLRLEYLKKNIPDRPPLKFPIPKNQRIIPTAWQSRPITQLSLNKPRLKIRTAQTQPISPRTESKFCDIGIKFIPNARTTLQTPTSYRNSKKNSFLHRNSFSDIPLSQS